MSRYYAAMGATLDGPSGLAARFASGQDQQTFASKVQQLNSGVAFPLAQATWLDFPTDMALQAAAISLTESVDVISRTQGRW